MNTSSVAKFGEIMPAPLAWTLSRTVPACERDVERDLFGEGVGGADRLGEVVGAVLAQLAADPRDASA